MATKTSTDTPIDACPITTTKTISDAASEAEIGRLDNKTALMIKLCESREENKCYEKIVPLKSRITELDVKYKNALRELRDTLQSIKFDDFLKVLIGISGGIVVRAASQQTINAFLEDSWVRGAGLLFIVCFIFLIARFFMPSKRKKEIMAELKRMELNND